jgi:hypothetical protein
MSRITLSGNASGTGNFTLASPNSNTDRTLTLPDAAGLMYNQGSIVGTVSQSGGVPTGAIIEQGSNANGSYIKYANGTMICLVSTPEVSSNSNLQFHDSVRTWPATFSEVPRISLSQASPHGDVNAGAAVIFANDTLSGSLDLKTNYRLGYKVFLASNYVVSAFVTAIGRWF